MALPTGSKRAGLLLLIVALGLSVHASCTSKELDPRIQLDGPYERQEEIAQFINGSHLWQAYLDYLSPGGATPAVSVHLEFERRVTRKTTDGDYDPGTVTATLLMKNLVSGRTILKNEDRFAIKDFVFVGDENATRDEIQAAAFSSTEDTAMRFVLYSLDLGVLYGMKEEGPAGAPLVPALEQTVNDQFAGDKIGAAKAALRAIQGG